MASKKTEKPPVMVFDIHRGVYFGYLVEHDIDRKMVRLEGAKHCFYYPAAKTGPKGVYGLAIVGPGEKAKVGPAVNMIVHDISKVVECTTEAHEAWKVATWK